MARRRGYEKTALRKFYALLNAWPDVLFDLLPDAVVQAVASVNRGDTQAGILGDVVLAWCKL